MRITKIHLSRPFGGTRLESIDFTKFRRLVCDSIVRIHLDCNARSPERRKIRKKFRKSNALTIYRYFALNYNNIASTVGRRHTIR